MIRAIAGFILLLVAGINYPSFYSKGSEFVNHEVRKFSIYSFLGFFALSFQGLLGCAIFLGAEREYHTVLGFLLVELVILAINIDILRLHVKNQTLSINRELFEVTIYILVIFLFLDKIYTFITFGDVIILLIPLTLILVVLTFYFWKYTQMIHMIVEFLDLRDPAKIFAFTSMLFASCGIVADLYPRITVGAVLVSAISLLIMCLIILKNMYKILRSL